MDTWFEVNKRLLQRYSNHQNKSLRLTSSCHARAAWHFNLFHVWRHFTGIYSNQIPRNDSADFLSFL